MFSQSPTQLIPLILAVITANGASAADVWIGTGGHSLSKGIYHCTLNQEDGKLTEPTLVAEVRAPGFLARHPTLPCLYAVGTLNKQPSVVAWQIEQSDDGPTLKLLNSVAVGDGGATHLAVDATGKTIVTAQYGRGSTAVFSLNDDGSIKERTQLIPHKDASGVRKNQTSPHPHWAGFSPDNKFAFVPDLGKDEVVIYRLNADTSTLQAHGAGTLPPGAGPRHMKFHPNGKWIYVLNENDVSVTHFDYNAESGIMNPRNTEAAVPREELAKELKFSASEIRIHPNGLFLYSANRGHDTVTAFRIAQEDGHLTVIERENVRGARPRNFNLDPTGKWLLAAGQDSHTVASFAVDQKTGELIYNHSIVFVPNPICIMIE